MNRSHFLVIISLLLLVLSCSPGSDINYSDEKPRIIVTTDIGGDPDDRQSLIRLLLYSNEFRIEALIASASGTPGELGIDTVKEQLLRETLEAYGEVLPSLRNHSSEYPDKKELMSKIKRGNPHRGIHFIGQDMDSEASDYIIETVDRNEAGKINICVWGGQTDLVQALWKVKNSRKRDDYLKFINRLRIYDINDQDGLYSYIRKEFPDLFYILAKSPEGIDKREGAYRGMYYGGDETLTSLEWLRTHVTRDHGPLGEMYPEKTWTAPNPYSAMKEGDTPSWFYFLLNGLQDPDNPSWGGWGGRFEPDSANYYRDASDFAGSETHPRATVYRWREYFQNDFAARMDWCVTDYEEANHRPVIEIEGSISKHPLTINAYTGQEITLSAVASEDPDGDNVEFYWWTYPEAGSNQVCPELENYLSPEVNFLVPEGEEGRDIHLICEVNDDGDPVLTSFRRIIIKIEE